MTGTDPVTQPNRKMQTSSLTIEICIFVYIYISIYIYINIYIYIESWGSQPHPGESDPRVGQDKWLRQITVMYDSAVVPV